jgi:2'-5' RNA ligase
MEEPPHITIKNSFKTNKEKKLVEILEDFMKKQKPSNIQIRGFGNFRKSVIFLKIKFPKEVENLRKKLIQSLRKNVISELHYNDINYVPHSTIIFASNEKNYNSIQKDLRKLKKPKFDLKFNKIVLMKKINGKMKIFKEFKLKENFSVYL